MKTRLAGGGRRGNLLTMALLGWILGVGAQTNPPPGATHLTESSAATGLTNTAERGLSSGGQPTYLTFGLDRLAWLQTPIFGNPLWKYLASLIYIALALYASKLIDLVLLRFLRQWAKKTSSQFDNLVVELLSGPVKVVCFVILLHVGLNLFAWPEWINKYFSTGLKLIVAGFLTYVTLRILDLVLNLWKGRTSKKDQLFTDHLFPVIRKSIQVFVLVVAILLTSQNLGLDITSLLASLSIGGLAIGLAAQDTLSNLFGAIAVYLDRPFQVGDRIKLDSVDGNVESIGLRSTCVRNFDGFLITIPNKTVAGATITNVSRRPTIRTVIPLGLTYDTSPEKIKRALRILNDLYRGHPQTHDVQVNFDKFTDSALNISVTHWWKGLDNKAYVESMENLNLAIKEQFDREGIHFAFPSQTVYLRQDTEWRVRPPENVA